MNIPNDRKYTKEHEWIKVDGKFATIGVTDHAQEQLGDIVFAELPKEGETVTKGETFGVLESVKAVSDCFSPVTGKIIDTNDVIVENPETVNEDPYGEGWMLKVELSDKSELDELMDDNAYKSFVEEETA